MPRTRRTAPAAAWDRDRRTGRRTGVPGGPAPPEQARDPIALVEAVRAEGTRSSLPFADRLGHLQPGGLEVYRGTAARRACEALGARALAVENVLLFGEDAPSLGTVLHELAHVAQQRAFHRSAGALSPSLALVDAAAFPEREARAFARGELEWCALERAPPAIYRADKKQDEEGSPWEERFKRFLASKKNEWKVAFLGVENAVFSFTEPKDGSVPNSEKVRYSSPRKFQHRDYDHAISDAVEGDLPQVANSGETYEDDEGKAYGLAKVGDADPAQRYALVRAADYKKDLRIYEIAAGKKETLEERQKKNAKSLQFYRDAVAGMKRVKGKVDWPKVTDPDTGKTVSSVPDRVTAADLRASRRAMIEKIVEAYSTKGGGVGIRQLYDEVIEPAVFGPPYTVIQGTIFEEWVKRRYTNIDRKKGQPVFDDASLGETIRGDMIIEHKGHYAIGEGKGLSSAPDQKAVEQMQSYKKLLSSKEDVRRCYFVDSEADTDTDDDQNEAETKKGTTEPKKGKPAVEQVVYFLPNDEIAGKWVPKLVEVFKPKPKGPRLFDTVGDYPVEPGKKELKLKIKENPVISVTVADALNEDPKHRVEAPKVTNPGITVQYLEVVLARPGYAPIRSGELSVTVETKGGPLASETPTVQKITPAVVDTTGPPTAATAEPDITGTAGNGVDNVKPSGLDKFLKRVHTEVKLVDDGLSGRIWVDPGESFVPKLNLDKAEITASYTLKKGFTAQGQVDVSYAPAPQKFKGSVTVGYAHGKWSFEGKATVAGLIEGLDPITASITHKDDVTRIGAKDISIARKIRGIDIHGKVKSLDYDVDKGSFNADGITLEVDLGTFGKASAHDVTIRDNALAKAVFDYESKELAYPKKSPIISGQLRGGLTYDQGKYSGHLGGTAYLKIPALERISKGLGDLGFVIDVGFKDDGKYSGSIALADDKPIQLGDYLRIPTLKLELGEDGSITSTFGLEVTEKLKYVKNAKVVCRLNADGSFEVLEASAKVKLGDETKDRVAAELGLSYQKGKDGQPAFIVSGKVWVRIKEGMVAVGELTYNTATGVIDATLSIDRIPLLHWGGHKPLLGIKKQIILFSIYGLGIYLDVRFELGFNYSFELGLTPKVKLEGLKLDDFTFALAIATVRLDGMLVAELVGKPGIGLGLFALHPKLLRGGGGLALPVSAKAVVNPAGTVEIRYKPDGNVEGGARVGLVLTFGITASLNAYAEFSVLDGLYEPTWDSGPLASFTIMEPRELFTYWIDFGKPLEKTEGEPAMPAEGGDAKAKGGGGPEKQRIGTKQDDPKALETPPRGKRDAELPDKPKEEPEAGKKGGGFDFMSLVDKLLDNPKFAPIKKVLDAAAATFGAIRDFFKAIYNFFKKWFGAIQEAIDAFVEAIKMIAEHGLIYYFKQLLKRKLGALYDIIEPLFTALEKTAGKFEDLIAKLMDDPIPLTPWAFLKWVLGVLKDVFSIAVSGIVDFVRAIRQVLANAADAFLKFVNYLVQEGKIGVRRYVYYIPGIRHNTYFYAPTEYKLRIWGLDLGAKIDGDLISWRDLADPSQVVHKAVAFLLYEFLDAFPATIKSTGGYNDPDVGDDTCRNFWVDKND